MLYSQPLFGLNTFGASSTEWTPCHSVAGSLPSTGFVQSNFVSRFGMKFEWKYAMLPSESAKTVLLDEFVCRFMISLNSAKFFAFVRV